MERLLGNNFFMTCKVVINVIPEFVFRTILSLSSLSCCTCGASSVPYVAVAIKHPPLEDGISFCIHILLIKISFSSHFSNVST